jgi:hypothetical protein
MRALAVTAALIGAVWATVSAQGAGDRVQFFKWHGQWTPTHHSPKGMRGRHPKWNSGPIDTLATWSSFFVANGFDTDGVPKSNWPFTMVGQSPVRQRDDRRGHDEDDRGGRTTWIPAPIIAVNLDLRNADGSPAFQGGQRLFIDATRNVDAVLKSPIFSFSNFTSSRRSTQYGDAIQRAQFFSVADDDWHTMLLPRVEQARTMVLRQSDDPDNAPNYTAQLNEDGTCCALVQVDKDAFLKAMFPETPNDTSTVVGKAENRGQITTRDLSIFLFNNMFLVSQEDPSLFAGGFHDFDSEPGTSANGWRERRYVLSVASFISGGVVGTDFADVAALSHEVTEAINDPFVANETPWWFGPNGTCKNILEGADVIEGTANETFPIVMNGTTYHPVNVALLPWFAGMSPSPAIDHAYSYPNTGVLTSPNDVSQRPGCGM